MNQYRYLLLISLFLLCGCSDPSRPADLPPLFPCTITVIQGGVPLEGAFVELVLMPDGQKFRPSAATDANGNAEILTYGFVGAPVGRYKILIRKSIDDNIVYGTNEYGERVEISADRFMVIAERYSRIETTPHEVEVTTRRTQLTVDVGEAVRIRVHD